MQMQAQHYKIKYGYYIIPNAILSTPTQDHDDFFCNTHPQSSSRRPLYEMMIIIINLQNILPLPQSHASALLFCPMHMASPVLFLEQVVASRVKKQVRPPNKKPSFLNA